VKKISISLFLSILPLTVFAQFQPTFSQAKDGHSALFTNGSKTIIVRLNDLPKEAAELNIDNERISTKIELRLRQAGLTPIVSRKSLDTTPDMWHLADQGWIYVNLDFLKVKSIDNAYITDITIDYNRPLSFSVAGKLYANTQSAWGGSRYGLIAKQHPQAVLNAIDEIMDDFLNEYLKENGL